MKDLKHILSKKEYLPLSEIKSKKYINNLKKIITIFAIIIIFNVFFYVRNIKNNLIYNLPILSKKTDNINKIDAELLNEFKKILADEEIIENELMSRHTTFKIGGPAQYFVKPRSNNKIIEIILLCNKHKVNYFILGNGSNLLVSDKGYYGVVILIHENNFSNLEIQKENENNYVLKVGGGMLMKTLSIEACLLSLTGLEDIIDIPGTVGGGIIMNASFRKHGLNIPLQKVKIITPEGILKELTNADWHIEEVC
jgi:UDP-N-acetylmuramate dehydrogenase